MGRSRSFLRWVAIVAVLAIVSGGCTRSSKSVESGRTEGTATTATGGGGGGGGTKTGGSRLASGGFGDLKNVCSKGSPKGSPDKGVSASEIKVGTVTDKGSTIRPGLDVEMYDTAVAFTKWCNEHGGVLGRKLSLTDLDAKLFNYPAAITKACQEDFAMVGGGAALDDGDNGARVKCGLPNIAGFTVSAKARAGGLQVQPLPVPVDRDTVGAFRVLAKVDPEAVKHFGVFTGDLASIVIAKDADVEGTKQFGYKVVFDRKYNAAGESNWRPFVEDMKSKGVQVLQFIGEPTSLTAMQKAMKTVGWYPKYTLQQANFYDTKYAAEGGSTAKGTYVRLATYPFEKAKDNPATQDYLDLMKQYNPSGKVALLGAQALSSWLLFAKAATECGSNLTRSCLIDKAKQVTTWTGGGLHGRSNPGGLEPTACFVAMRLDGNKFVYDKKFTEPDTGVYNCDPKNTAKLTNNYGVAPPNR
jgi:hypothetical protein